MMNCQERYILDNRWVFEAEYLADVKQLYVGIIINYINTRILINNYKLKLKYLFPFSHYYYNQ